MRQWIQLFELHPREAQPSTGFQARIEIGCPNAESPELIEFLQKRGVRRIPCGTRDANGHEEFIFLGRVDDLCTLLIMHYGMDTFTILNLLMAWNGEGS